MTQQADPAFANAVYQVLSDTLNLPQQFIDYMVQYQALNGLPIPIGQVTGYTEQIPALANIATSESTTSTTYADLATVGPQLTGLPNGKYYIVFAASPLTTSAGFNGFMSVQINSTAAVDADAVQIGGSTTLGVSWALIKTLTNNNSNTITVKYRSVNAGSSLTAANRWILAIKFSNV